MSLETLPAVPADGAPSAAPAAAAAPAPTATAADAARQARIDHFAARLAYETDPSDVRAAQLAGEEFTLVDVRGEGPWAQGRVAGALHLPHREIAARAEREIPRDRPVIVYCWGPGCNGGTRGALAFARLGYEVREMIGGYEYWAREGLPVVDDAGPVARAADPLTTVIGGGALAAATGTRAVDAAFEPDCDC
ncbi:MAG: hypothetical protein J0G30_02895 [Actinomycetales bacterium]|nr:hypothetical protein [Actinomycetales bacterium]